MRTTLEAQQPCLLPLEEHGPRTARPQLQAPWPASGAVTRRQLSLELRPTYDDIRCSFQILFDHISQRQQPHRRADALPDPPSLASISSQWPSGAQPAHRVSSRIPYPIKMALTIGGRVGTLPATSRRCRSTLAGAWRQPTRSRKGVISKAVDADIAPDAYCCLVGATRVAAGRRRFRACPPPRSGPFAQSPKTWWPATS